MNTSQVTVRNVDDTLKRAISAKARSSSLSINAWMLEAAREKAGIKKSSQNSSWKEFAGSIPMTKEEYAAAFGDLRKVNPVDWE